MPLTFSVVAEAHLSLAEANGVLALADAIELLELCLVDALQASRQPPMALEKGMFGRWKLTWLGTYSSMALMPTFWGLSDMMCGCVGSREGGDGEEDGRVQAIFFVEGVGERGVGAGVCGRTMAARWGLGMKAGREVSPDCDGEEVGREMKMGKGEGKQENTVPRELLMVITTSRQRLH
jgi:hypothetical protein